MLNKKFQLAECKSSFADLHEKIKQPEQFPVSAARRNRKKVTREIKAVRQYRTGDKINFPAAHKFCRSWFRLR